MSYFRATDPFPLESADQNKLSAFYEHLAAGRLVTTACAGCRRMDWPPRAFCPECGSDRYDWVDLPHDLLRRISNRIINEVRGVNRVCYDISSKPPSTIEWE